MTPNDLAERLRDIRDIDPVSPWPPGPGWWLLALAVAIVVILVVRYRPYRFIRQNRSEPDWRKSGTAELRALRARAGTEDAKQVASELSELMRRIAMARCGRDACAGLTGKAWLSWLRDHDPHRFDWPNKGALLADAPYAPTLSADAATHLETLIDAAMHWSAADLKPCRRQEEQVRV